MHFVITKEDCFANTLQLLRELFEQDEQFRNLIFQDAGESYTPERRKEFLDKKLYIQMAIEDLLEQCAGVLVLAKKGYRFQFYPGSSYSSVNYINRLLLPTEEQLSWIDVNLSIEKKGKL